MNIDRRTFAALTAAGALCLGAPRVPSSVPVETDERFPISTEDYTKVETEYLAQLVSYVTAELRGTIIIDTDNRFLYLVLGSSQAKRYGIGVGREGFGWSGTATIKRKTEWPA